MTLKSIMCRFKFGSLALLLCACADTTGPVVDNCVTETSMYYNPVTADTVVVERSFCVESASYRLP